MDVGFSIPEARESDRRFQDLVSNMHLVAAMLNANAELTYCNDYFLGLTGWTLPEVLGCNWFERFVPPGVDDLQSLFTDALKDSPNAWHHENEILCRSQARILIRWNNSAVRDSTGQVVGVACIGEDITERRLLERELLEASARERRHLAAELHDGLGQSLYGASLLTHSLQLAAQKSSPSTVGDLSQLASIIGRSIDTCRRIAHGISPLAEIQGGIVQALRDLTLSSPRSGPEIKLTVTDSAPLLIDMASLDHLYRLAQEGLSNALQHSYATMICVGLDIQPMLVTLTIVDDGIGLPLELRSSKRFGLKLMRYRADILHANLTFTRIDPHGTRITCECPNANSRCAR
jgi:PAS domain S-box-containing protein